VSAERFVVGIDIGGTYTDLVAVDDTGERTVVKTPTTPHDPAIGMMHALGEAAAQRGLALPAFFSRLSRICHGTTVTTNAVIERTGARVGMLTTKGVRDTIEVRRGIRELDRLYDYTYPQPRPLCPRNLRIPIAERIQADASVHVALDEEAVRGAVRAFKDQGIEAIAICFLWSFRNPAHELRAAAICREEYPQAFVSLSHEIAPQLGEYLRFQTTVVNAYVGPTIERYMTALESRLAAGGYRGPVLIVTSSGGVMTPQAIMAKPVVTLTSGPASGPVAGSWCARKYGIDRFITMDMGGTSFDTALVKHDEIATRSEQTVAGVYHIGLPAVDVHAIGAGGGTLAWLDSAGGLHVGPASAGADPGPACYSKGGTRPTVTDANLILGRLNPASAIAGGIRLDARAAAAALRKIAAPKGLSIEAMARAIVAIVDVNMADAIEVISIRRGENPADYVLISAGGAGALHAVQLARMLKMSRVIVPRESGLFCALGCLISDIRHDFAASVESPTARLDWERLNAQSAAMLAAAHARLDADNVPVPDRRFQLTADMKYIGQYQQIEVKWPQRADFAYSAADVAAIERLFHARHEAMYAHHDETEKTFVSNLKLTAFGRVDTGVIAGAPPVAGAGLAPRTGTRAVWFEETGYGSTPIYDGEGMSPGAVVDGPCVIELATTTIVAHPQCRVTVTEHGDFRIDLGTPRSTPA
jgi:N-methylhydantoinase A